MQISAIGVKAAGEIYIANGKILDISGYSEHYQLNPTDFNKALNVFKQSGLASENTFIVDRLPVR